MKKIFFIILVTILGILALNIIYFEFFVSRSTINSTNDKGSSELMFTSLYGDYDIFVDNKLLGRVKDRESKIFENISSGIKDIRIKRVSSVDDFYYVLNRNIIFEPNARVEIKWESGPTLESSRGIIKYFIKKFSPKGTEVIIQPFWPQTYAIYNSQILKDSALLIEKPQSLRFTVLSDDNNFESLEVELSIFDQFDEVPKNVQLVVEVYLYKNPIRFN